MRQIGTPEKVDPLTRIQEEIKEVARREQELRELLGTAAATAGGGGGALDGDETTGGGGKISTENDSNASNDDLLVSSQTPSLTLSVNSKESLDENDSGISASSSPVNGVSANHDGGKVLANDNNKNTNVGLNKISNSNRGYIRPNGYNPVPLPPPQKILTRTVSTPQIFTPNRRTIQFGFGHKGLMQRFIATRGKIALKNNSSSGSGSTNNNNSSSNTTTPTDGSNPLAQRFSNSPQNSLGEYATINGDTANYIPRTSPTFIARDANGKPIRRGYIPVEVKIQKELNDLKSRESELKKIRKIRQSTPDLLDSIDNEALESDEDDSEIEHCYGPGKLRSAKSISELCDSAHSNNSMSTRTTPSPDFENKIQYNRTGGGGGGMRPAVSLAQLCDLDPEDAPSSHRLIAQWENLIQQNA